MMGYTFWIQIPGINPLNADPRNANPMKVRIAVFTSAIMTAKIAITTTLIHPTPKKCFMSGRTTSNSTIVPTHVGIK